MVVYFALERRVFKLVRRSGRGGVAENLARPASRGGAPSGGEAIADGEANLEDRVTRATPVRRFGTTRSGGEARDRQRGPCPRNADGQQRRGVEAGHARKHRRTPGA